MRYNGIMSIDEITAKLKEKLTHAPGLEAKVKFDFRDDGNIVVDTTQSPPEIEQNSDEDDLDLTLECAMDTFKGILDGSQDPNISFMMGKLKVKGNMGLAMKLNSVLED